MKVITIGAATQDIFIHYKNKEMLRLLSKKSSTPYVILKEGSKIEVEKLEYYMGGGATNSAVSFSRLGFDSSTILKTGSDNQSRFIIKNLQKEKIDTSLISFSKKTATGVSIVIPSLTGDRTIFTFKGANTELTKKNIIEKDIAKCSQLYITSLSGESSKLLPHIIKIAKKHKISVAINPGISELTSTSTGLIEILPNIDILILNTDEANIFMHTLAHDNTTLQRKIKVSRKKQPKKHIPKLLQSTITYQNISFSIHHFFREMIKRGPKIIVITNGAEGVYIASKKTIYFHPSIPTIIASTLGAGDAFGSCFTANIALGKSIEESILRGIINSTSVISHFDARTGLLRHKELEKRSKKITSKKILKFKL